MKKFLALFIAVIMLCGMMATICSCTGNQGDNGSATTEAPASSEIPAATTGTPAGDSNPPETTNAPTSEKTVYTIKVQDAAGNPVAGVIVKLCEGDVCRKPGMTAEDGTYAYSFIPNGEPLKAMIEVADQQEDAFKNAYDFSSDYVYLEEGATEVILTVTAK